MRICIPTVNDAGLGGRLSPHFGRAQYFTLVDVEQGRACTSPNPHAMHEEGERDATRVVEDGTVDAVVCRGIGPRALERLRAYGVPVLHTGAWTVAGAIRELREGKLTRLTADAAHLCREEPMAGFSAVDRLLAEMRDDGVPLQGTAVLDAVEHPRWDRMGGMRDWRFYVPPSMRRVWHALPLTTRLRLFEIAELVALEEDAGAPMITVGRGRRREVSRSRS